MKKKSIVGISVICASLFVVCVCVFVPVKKSEDITVPAIIFSDDKLETDITNLSIEGIWNRSIANPSHQSFAGVIQVDALNYTHKESGWNLDFQITNDMSDDCLSGGFFYNSNFNSDFTGYGWLYTDKNHTYYILVTNKYDSLTEDYIVIAPAETKEEARNICNILGLDYLQN